VISYKETIVGTEFLGELNSKYRLESCEGYIKYSKLFRELEKYVFYDYYIIIPKIGLLKLIKNIFGEYDLLKNYDYMMIPNDDFNEMINSKKPFIYFNGILYSNIHLFSRFIIYLAEDYLNKNKTYQIDSGFLFQKIVVDILKENKFEVKDITRLKNDTGTFSEFDIVSIKCDTIYNFQCKNNLLDISNIKVDNLKFKKENYKLIKMYETAYKKEIKREDIILNKLGQKNIRHIVLSRFPVITRKKYIVTFQNLEGFLEHI
jgi:hypothetical protein